MEVIKRDGRKEPVKFDKITARIEKLSYSLDRNYVEPIEVAKKVISGIYDGVTTIELDNLAAEICATMATVHPDYAVLAARIAISNLHKTTSKSFSATVKKLYNYIDPKTEQKAGLISKETYDVVRKHSSELNSAIIYDRDYQYDFFGFKTLERSYLLKIDGKVVERPQHMIMRVAVGIHGEDIEKVIETYNLMSEKWFTHATPTLFNAGTPKPQLSSCFVAGTKVFTINQGVKNIEDVEIGDLVVTHKGNVKPVVQLHKNPLNNRQIYDFKTYGSPNIQVTDNHKFWSISKEQIKWGEEPQWNSVEYLREGDYIALPQKKAIYLPQKLDLANYVPESYGEVQVRYTQDQNFIYPTSHWIRKHKLNENDKEVKVSRSHNPVKKEIIIDSEFAFILGLWFGDGHIVTGRDKNKVYQFTRGIGVTFHKDALQLIAKTVKNFRNIFGIEPSVTKPNATNTVSVIVHSHVVGHFFEETFGKHFSGKKLANFMYQWDYNMVQSFMEGLVSADGCVTKSGDVRITMSNVNLVKSIYALCRNVGMFVSYSESKMLKKGATRLTARISLAKQSILLNNVIKNYDDDRLEKMLDKEAMSASMKEIDGKPFIRISQKIKSSLKPEYVYTLGVEDDHSYVVEGIVAENCFLLTAKEDSINGIYDTLKDCALISQSAGGIGLSIHKIRATGSYIKGTNGYSNGIIPMLRVFNDTARYVDQGGNKRKGAFAIYLEPWHADVFDFLDLKKNHGKEELRARDLFYAMWISDLFMQRVENDENWSLFCPNEAPGLADVYGEEFEALYLKYEQEGKARKVVKAQDLWFKILESQIETGTPYMLYKDHANRKSNQKNLGTIRSSNLCTEVMEYTAPDETAVCNLASIALSKFVENGKFDHQKLYEVTKVVTRNLNKVIDINYYPIPEARNSNMRHRPVGIGVQGLADAFIMMRMPFDSPEAKQLNKDIFETIYYAALETSMEIAQKDGAYESFEGSPISQGIFQFDMWGVNPTSGNWDWEALRSKVKEHGVRNSLLLAPMPTASTSQILGNNECFEPYTSNVYSRRVLSGEFAVVNKHLLKDLVALGLWDSDMKNRLIAENGSVQNIPEVPNDLKEIYKTVWEIKQKNILDMAADRGAFICQSQSMNVFMENPSFGKLTSMHFYAWKKGLKTGMYYLRTKSAADAIKFTVDKSKLQAIPTNAKAKVAEQQRVKEGISNMIQSTGNISADDINNLEGETCAIDDPDCLSCGS